MKAVYFKETRKIVVGEVPDAGMRETAAYGSHGLPLDQAPGAFAKFDAREGAMLRSSSSPRDRPAAGAMRHR